MMGSLAGRLFALYSIIATASGAYAQEPQSIIDDFSAGMLPIEAAELPLLLPFAAEWDSVVSKSYDLNIAPTIEQYQALALSDEQVLIDSMSALANNPDAVDFFANEETIEAFNLVYDNAINERSSVGMIPHDDAMRFWVVSRTLATGPEALASFRIADPRIQWCLPPLISCTPPEPIPVPEDKD